jgi:hypothetical protein
MSSAIFRIDNLYNMMHGYEPTAGFVLQALNVNPDAIPRFRDAYVTYRDKPPEAGEKAGVMIMVILTRTGGPNRPDYEVENASLRLLPGFIDDVDDEFDSTFALFRYTLPDQWRPQLVHWLSLSGPPMTLRQKTDQVVGPDQTKRQRAATDHLVNMLSEKLKKS